MRPTIPHRAACALVVSAAVAAAWASPALAAPSSESVLVDAQADGDTPITGGLIHVSPCARPGASLRQSNGARAERTNSRGVALLDFQRLPSCFVVSVSGGRVDGRSVPGAFRAEAHNQSGQIISVLVTPVSTLTYSVRRAHPGMSRAGARHVVRELLGIPSHFDDIDLAADDTPFDGDRYIAAASHAGGVGTLDGALMRTAQRDRRHTFHARNAQVARPANALQSWWNETDVNKMVRDGLKDFGLSILGDAASTGGKWILGRLLDEWGLKDLKDFLLPKPDTVKIIEMIQELTRRVNNLQETSDAILKEVTGIAYDVKKQQATTLISRVKTIQQSMVNLMKLDQADPGRTGATKWILDEIKVLEKDRNLLNELLTQTETGGDGILKAASRKAALQDRWFTPADSQSVQDVYKYFAIYQLRLANLLVEYWNTRSCSKTPAPQDCLSPQKTIQPELDQIQTGIDAQKALLKPPLPAGTFVDRTTMRMWPLASWPLNGFDALTWTAVWQPQTCRKTGVLSWTCWGSREYPYPLPRRTNLPLPALGPWSDWQFPSADDYKNLIDGWKGDSPLAWLNEKVGFRTTTMSTENDRKRLSGHMWLSDSFRPGAHGLYVYRTNLSEPDNPGPHVWYQRADMPAGQCEGSTTCTETQVDFSDIRNNYTAQMLLWRPVKPGDYWEP